MGGLVAIPVIWIWVTIFYSWYTYHQKTDPMQNELLRRYKAFFIAGRWPYDLFRWVKEKFSQAGPAPSSRSGQRVQAPAFQPSSETFGASFPTAGSGGGAYLPPPAGAPAQLTPPAGSGTAAPAPPGPATPPPPPPPTTPSPWSTTPLAANPDTGNHNR